MLPTAFQSLMIIYRIESDGGNVNVNVQKFSLMSLRFPIHEVMLTRCCDFSHHFPNHMTACDNILPGKTPAWRPPLVAIISLPLCGFTTKPMPGRYLKIEIGFTTFPLERENVACSDLSKKSFVKQTFDKNERGLICL